MTSLTVEAVRETVGAFYKRVPTGQCANCGAFGPVIKRCAPPCRPAPAARCSAACVCWQRPCRASTIEGCTGVSDVLVGQTSNHDVLVNQPAASYAATSRLSPVPILPATVACVSEKYVDGRCSLFQ